MPACSPSLSSMQLHLVAVLLGPARVHAHQHLGPVLRLGAAGAGVDLDVAVVAVGLAGQQAFDLAPLRLLGQRAQRRQRRRPPSPRRPRPRPARSVRRVSATSRSSVRTPSIAVASRLRSRITLCAAAASFQRSGSSARAFSSSRRATATSQSKMPPQQRDGLLDLFVKGVGFGGHRRARSGAALNTARPCVCRPRLPAPARPPPARRRIARRRSACAGAGAPIGAETPGSCPGLNASVTVPKPLSQLAIVTPGGHREGQHRPALQRDRHEVVPDRGRDGAAGLVVAEACRACRSRPTPRSPDRA